MEEQNQLLQVITHEIKSSMDDLAIVTPTVFTSLFSELAKKHQLVLNDEEKNALQIIEKECGNLTTLQAKTSDNALRLSNSTSRAISAIREKDETILNEVLQEIQVLREEIEKLKETMYKDMLTNTFNRKWLHDNYIKNQSNVSKRTGVLALIDLNYFKEINDTYGHVIGDKVLVFLAGEFLKIGYPVVRYGGDEFIIMFPDTLSEKHVHTIMTNTREDILKKKFKANQHFFTVSFSFGLQGFNSNEVCTEVLESADRNMYEDKIVIKNRIKSI
ncbi:MAG: GGDEF domain-containing protein [Campylobacterales bacterium]|nr:GGDEF domain-containing protein [Campylobacterales bacterium]